MNEELNKENQDSTEAPAIDDWASAFASLEPKVSEEPSNNADGEAIPSGEPDPNTPATSDSTPAKDGTSATNGVVVESGSTGGSDPAQPVPSGSDDSGSTDATGLNQTELTERVTEITSTIEQQAMQETAKLMIEKNIRHNDRGQLGATINDPDIYRKDENGVPTFFNPDTGKPFSGDNPRAQARQWVKEYNDELREVFDKMAADRAGQLQEQAKPIINLLNFAPKFEKLDPIRQSLMDAIIEDYEILDKDGNCIGYNCDLNAALNQVNRQIEKIRATQAPAATSGAIGANLSQGNPAPVKTSPAVDMKAGAGSTSSKPEFKNMAEAMEWEQDQLIAKMRKGK